MSYLAEEIHAQPGVLRRLIAEESGTVRQISAAIRAFAPAFIYIAARGTSDNAARYAQYVLGGLARLTVALATPSLHTLYAAPPDLARALVIGISQSGASTDINQVILDAREQGALTLGITNTPESPLAKNAAHHIYLHAEEERSVAATKTYTAELTAVALLAAALADDEHLHSAAAQLPDYAEQTLDLTANLPAWVQRYRYAQHFAAIGRGYNYCTAFEVSLKIKELCYLTGHGYSEADFRHGPMALLEPGFPVVVVAPQGKTLPILRDFLQLLNERRAEALVISNDEDTLRSGRTAMPIPAMPEWLTPVCAVIPGQLFAMHLAAEKGYAVDTPRGIQKVTVTQ